MTNGNNFTAVRASAHPTPFPNWRTVKVTARLGSHVAESINFRRPGGMVYSTFAGSIHESTPRIDRQLYRATLRAAEAAIPWDDDDV